MKQTIRYNTFETNSSSTHSCVICSDEIFEKWKSGEVFVDDWNGTFHTREEIKQEFKKENQNLDEDSDDFEDNLHDYIIDNYKSYEDFGNNYEVDVNYAEVDGVKVVVTCYYGYDN